MVSFDDATSVGRLRGPPLRRRDPGRLLPAVPGPADDRAVHPAVVRRQPGCVDDLPPVLPSGAPSWLCLRALLGRPGRAAAAGAGPCRAARCVARGAPHRSLARVEGGRGSGVHPVLVILSLLAGTIGAPCVLRSSRRL